MDNMNNQLIKKIISSSGISCPEFRYNNPLLDKNIAEALSKSFVKILNLSERNLRLPVLEYIRKMCQTQPEHHVNVYENTIALLSDLYIQKIREANCDNTDSIERELDAFLIRNLKEMEITSTYNPALNPEILLAFKNLNLTGVDMNTLLKDIIHLNNTHSKNIHILQDLCSNDSTLIEDISIKLKPELEQLLLQIIHTMFTENTTNIDEIFSSNNPLQEIIEKSANSPNCFQICCSILNYVFINTNFNNQMQKFIQKFVSCVKLSCPVEKFSVLYPVHLMHVVVLLNMQLELLNRMTIENVYIQEAIGYLCKLNDNDLIMLLSHFPQWHDVYFRNNDLQL